MKNTFNAKSITERFKKLSGAGLAASVFQVTALLYGLYILAIPGYYRVITFRNILSFLADLSLAALPRAAAAGASFIYRITENEVIVFFVLLALALIWGMIVKRLERPDRGKKRGFLIGYAVLVFADLVVRILPLSVNQYPGIGFQIAGAVIRLFCLGLVLWELRKRQRQQP
ncbi:MAG: hypothetical protein IJL98_08755 [Lachnospiraceae bacterium]|nr:hypothetical protein [Lachnospiraceae bacterium]